MSDDKGKGMLAGGGVLALIGSLFAHTADDCARVGARGAAMGHGVGASARLGAEAAVGAKAGVVLAGDGSRVGARGAMLGAEAAEVGAGARVMHAGAGVDPATGLLRRSPAPYGAAEAGEQTAARLSPVQRQVAEEIPGHALDLVDLAPDEGTSSSPAPPASSAPPRSSAAPSASAPSLPPRRPTRP